MRTQFPFKTIVFWQSIVSQHQFSYINELADNFDGISVIYVVDILISNHRLMMGIDPPTLSDRIKLYIKPDKKLISEILQFEESIHLFEGIRGYETGWKVIRQATKLNCRIGVISEDVNLRGYRGFLRRAASLFIERRYAKKIEFFLCISRSSEKWYRKCGVPDSKIYPFVYVVDIISIENVKYEEIYTFVFVGSLVYGKGIDILIKALNYSKSYNWKLVIVGDGVEKSRLIKLSESLGLQNKISFVGVLPNNKTINMIQQSDLLVLPSRYDGWGAVVNESLMSGTPVVCSDNCGASMLLDKYDKGSVFRCEDVDELKVLLRGRMLNGKQSKEERNNLSKWAQCIGGTSVANYLINVLSSLNEKENKPSVPWLS